MPEIPEDVTALLETVTSDVRRRDAYTLLELMERVTGLAPYRTGSMVGFGQYHYRYESGREGDAAAAGFAPRKAATVVYLLDGLDRHAAELAELGPHRAGVGCLYLTDLAKVDLTALERVVRRSFETLTAGVYGLRARDGE